jgi:hypothetical protein
MFSLLLLISSAFAARHELTFEVGTTVVEDNPAQNLYGAGGTPQFGLRVGGAVLRHPSRFGLVVGGAWGRTTTQGGVIPYTADWTVEQSEYTEINTRLVIDRFGLGLRADYDVRGAFFPLVRAEARLAVVSSTLTSPYDYSDDALAIRQAGVAPGGRFTAGFEVMVPDQHLPVTVGFSLEAGYEVNGRAKLGEMGFINPSGPVVTAGVGLRL